MEIHNQLAVVTGGGSGIGRGLCLVLAEAGARVVVVDIERDDAEVVAAEVRELGAEGHARQCDVGGAEAVEALAQEVWEDIGPVGLLLNNAGVGAGARVLETAPENAEWIMRVNFFGVWYGCVAFGRRMAEKEAPGWIVNTGSEHSLGVPHLGSGLYTASKHAVHGLTAVLRAELPEHIGISLFCPGLVNTRIWNSGMHRPAAFGGASEGNPAGAAFMAEGMDALEVARQVVEAVRAEHFYIVTHAHVHEFAAERQRELDAAFAEQAPRYDGDDCYHVGKLRQRLRQRRDTD